MLAGVALREDNIEQVRTLADEARALARDRNDARLEQVPLHMLAVAARMAGDLSSARALYQESIELSRRLSDERLVAVEHHNLGSVELRSYRTARALQLFEEAGVETRRLNYAELFSYLVADLAVAAAEKGDPERAARVVGATSAAFAAKGKVPDPDDAVEQERLRPRLVEALGQEHDSRPPPREAFAAATRRTRRAHSKGYLVAPPQRVGPSRKQRGDRTRDAFREPRHDVDELERTAAKPAPRHVPGEHPSAGELDRGPVQVCRNQSIIRGSTRALAKNGSTEKTASDRLNRSCSNHARFMSGRGRMGTRCGRMRVEANDASRRSATAGTSIQPPPRIRTLKHRTCRSPTLPTITWSMPPPR